MGDPVFGIVIRRVDEEARPVLAADLSTIGLIGPADAAQANMYPINEPVHVDSDRTEYTSLIGTEGYLSDAIEGINNQLGETQFAARCVIVRTERGVDADPVLALQKTINNICGSSLHGTGLWAFLKSPHKLGFTPRIIMAPGHTSQMANGIGNVVQTVTGAGYVQDQAYEITFEGGGANAIPGYGYAYGQQDGSLGNYFPAFPGAWYDVEGTPTAVVPPPFRKVTAAVVEAGGADYEVGDTISLSNQVDLEVATVDGSGAVLTVNVLYGGMYPGIGDLPEDPQAQLTTSSLGSGATFNLTWGDEGTKADYSVAISVGANPVCSSLPSVLNQLIGHAIVESAGYDAQNDLDWRETLSSDRLIPISGGCRVMDPETSYIIFRPLAPRIAGILVRRDHETGAPFHSAANQAVQGIIGPMRDIPFALTDDANEAQELLKYNLGVLVRGEIGNDFAIANGGFVFIGTDNAGEDELWRFYNVMRGRDYIHLGLLRALRFFLGRYNIRGHTIQAILNTMKYFLRDLKAQQHILGYQVTFRADGNSVEEIRQGHLTVGFKAEEPPPLRRITIESARYRDAISAMISELATQLNLTSV